MGKRKSGSSNTPNKPSTSKPSSSSQASAKSDAAAPGRRKAGARVGTAQGSKPKAARKTGTDKSKNSGAATRATNSGDGGRGAVAATARPAKKASGQRRSLDEAVPIVGIGASAGGLEAFTQLLGALPSDTGMAFVLVSHLSHTHKSLLTELLAKTTAMQVSQVTEATPVAANHVYVIPPNMNLSISDGTIEVSALEKERRPHMSIDFFLRSLAENRKNRAIGVLLSGTGSDGTHGLAAIKAEGGITFAQDEASARYGDMPRSATQSGSVDFVLPPDQIAVELTRIARHPYVTNTSGTPATEDEAPVPGGMSQIFSLIRAATGVDFSLYKPTTIKRRVSRRLLLHKIEHLADYLSYLKANAGEIESLYQDLLINVTGFFRDINEFGFLREQIIPKIVASRPKDEPIRVWVPGCASGEEVYSLAICLLEALGDHGSNTPLQIFATDVSETAIRRAREGYYPENLVGDVSPEQLRRFFIPTHGGYQISKQIRDFCVFASQNLAKDPPFSRLHLISCRNVLIYLGTPLQRRVLATFHYALRPGGFLVLGGSETTGAAAELFEQVGKQHKVFVKLPSMARPQFDLLAGETIAVKHATSKAAGQHEPQRSPDLGKEADRIVLARYSPPGVVVNSAHEILQFRGRTSDYLEPSPGEASLNLFRMAKQGLVIDLRAAVHQAGKSAMPVRKEGVPVHVNGGVRAVDLEVIPLGGQNAAEVYFLVLFHDTAVPPPAPSTATPKRPTPGKGRAAAAERELESMRRELAATQGDLHSIIEEQEASNEELQSANEEILSANEELQSTNEEMETAKEELQATNEELSTVNDELQNRNAELTQANNDLQNLLATSDVVMVMVGHDLRIRRLTPSAQRVLNLIAGDVGRPLSNIKTNLRVDNLEGLIADVIDRITPLEAEVQDTHGRWYSMRVRPYRTDANKIEGAVMILVDIDAIKRNQESEAVWRALVEPLPDFVLSADPEGKVLFLNRTMASLAQQVAVGENIYDFIEQRDHASLKSCLHEVMANGKAASFASSGKPGTVTHVKPIKSRDQIVALTIMTGTAE